VSNLSGKLLDPLKPKYFETFARHISLFDEKNEPSRVVASHDEFKKFGLTDAVIVALAKEKKHLVLTADLPLYQYLQKQKVDAINFNQIRPLNW
jgi:uncharacterized protein YacL